MENYTTSSHVVNQSIVSTLFKSTYMQMAAALAVTGLTAFFLSDSATFLSMLEGSTSILWIALFAELGVVMWLSAALHRLSMTAATLLFIFYSVLNGVTLSTIFMMYTTESIATTFFVTAGTFFVMSLIGYVTRIDLSRMGNILMMMLVGFIIATVVNIFLASGTLYWILTYAGVIIFVGLTAWDTQKLKMIYLQHGTSDESGQKLALLGALTLYLDFVNLFLFLLRIFGDRR